MGQPTVLAKRANKAAASSVSIGVVGWQIGKAPIIERGRNLAVFIVKKRPVKKATVGHQSPLKTGFSFPTKA
jgi:hypothetical protein